MKLDTGLYRGIVIGVQDPEARGRVMVSVYTVHSGPLVYRQTLLKDLPAEGTDEFTQRFGSLPWCPVIAPAAKLRGTEFPYQPGDLVWVQFEGGDAQLPVVVGGWVSASHAIVDLLPDQSVSVDLTTREKWQLSDDLGNLLEFSPLGDENRIKATSGFASVAASENDDSVRVDAHNIDHPGTYGVHADVVSIHGQNGIFARGTDIFMQAYSDNAKDDPSTLAMYSTWRTEHYGQDESWYGEYLSRQVESSDAGNSTQRVWNQSRFAAIAPKKLVLGFSEYYLKIRDSSYPQADLPNIPDTETVDIQADQWIVLRAVNNSQGVNPSPGTGNSTSGNSTPAQIGLYSNYSWNAYAGNLLWLGQYAETDVRPRGMKQTPRTLIDGDVIQIGSTGNSEDSLEPDATLPKGTYSSTDVSIRADSTILIASSGFQANSPQTLPDPTQVTNPTPLTVSAGSEDGDITIWADNNLLLMANGLITIGGQFPAVVVNGRANATGGGLYLGRKYYQTASFSSTSTLNLPGGLRDPGTNDCVIANPTENGQNTHSLATPFWGAGVVIGKTTDTGLDIVLLCSGGGGGGVVALGVASLAPGGDLRLVIAEGPNGGVLVRIFFAFSVGDTIYAVQVPNGTDVAGVNWVCLAPPYPPHGVQGQVLQYASSSPGFAVWDWWMAH